MTHARLSSKTAIDKSCKGLGLGDEIADYLKLLIPSERNSLWTIKECLYGNPKMDRKPVKEFVNEINKYEYLRKCVEQLEGLITNRGIHASGVLITNEPFTETISCMRSPTGLLCTSLDLDDAEYCGGVKMDMLTVQGADKMHKTMDLLLEYGKIEWQGSLKATYDKYLHPDVIDYNNPEMWEIISDVYSVFQFDTDVGKRALSVVKPHSLAELSATNSLMRLQVSGSEQPLDTFIRYKTDIHEWEKDCKKWGLTNDEMDVIREYLSGSYMLAESQEKVMRLSMDKRIAGFTLKEANKLRKGIAKKDPKVREETQKQFYEWGERLGTRKVFLDYVWNEVFGKSFG